MINNKLLASIFRVIPHTKRMNVGCIKHFVRTYVRFRTNSL